MNATVAVVHYPEGAGHATRMLAVARELEARGVTVELAGGGPGERFVELLGYEEYVPTVVDFIGDYQGGGSLADVLTGSVPDAVGRVRDVVRWLRRVDADCVVTDDMFASVAAVLARVPQYVCTHNTPGYYDDVAERVGAAVLTRQQVSASRRFFYPAVWPELDGDPRGVERVPPVALDVPLDAAETPGVDVLISPSTYSTALDEVADRLREAGREVTVVGGEGWTTVASMLPVFRAANVVVCPGYSTVMEAAVAGTPCVVYPFTSEQRGVARFVERGGEPGFAVAETPTDAVAAVENPPDAPAFENGAPVVADRVVDEFGG
jgi:UDP:flavonoid glycosyltransferase YjiC (YdhE family)